MAEADKRERRFEDATFLALKVKAEGHEPRNAGRV